MVRERRCPDRVCGREGGRGLGGLWGSRAAASRLRSNRALLDGGSRGEAGGVQVLAEKGRDGPRLGCQEAELARFLMEWVWVRAS